MSNLDLANTCLDDDGVLDDLIEEGSINLTLDILEDTETNRVRVRIDTSSDVVDFDGENLDFVLEFAVPSGILILDAKMKADEALENMTGTAEIRLKLVGGDECAMSGEWVAVEYDPEEGLSCPSSGGSATSPSNPLVIGTVIGHGNQFSSCQGFQPDAPPPVGGIPGQRTADHFEFTIVADGRPGDTIRVTWRNSGPEPDPVIVAIVDPSNGAVILQNAPEINELPDGRTERVVDMFTMLGSITGGPLKAGTWILRTGRATTSSSVPKYDILFNAPE